MAIRATRRLNRHFGTRTNPTEEYVIWGRRLARIGIIFTVLLVATGYAVRSEMFPDHRDFYGCPASNPE
jgi:hypothetical protein